MLLVLFFDTKGTDLTNLIQLKIFALDENIFRIFNGHTYIRMIKLIKKISLKCANRQAYMLLYRKILKIKSKFIISASNASK